MTEELAVTEPKRRGRPPKKEAEPVVVSPDQLARYMREILGERDHDLAKQNGSYDRIAAHNQQRFQATAEWEAQVSCPKCHAKPGYNPLTGVWVRAWDQSNRRWIDGHRASCVTLALPAR